MNGLIERSELLELSMPVSEFVRQHLNTEHVVSVNQIIRAEVVDAEPVRHGRWYKPTGMMPPEHHGRHRCTVCDHMALYFRIGHEELSPYCPNCGAKMMEVQDGT